MKNMLIIDLETQNYFVESGIYEVACLVVEDYAIIDKLYLGKELKGYIGDRRYGYGFYDISQDYGFIKEFKSFTNKYPYPIVAHNCSFDKKFLLYYDWLDSKYLFYCSMWAIRREVSNLASYSLQNLVRCYNIADDTDHQAMSDVINLYKLLKIIKPGKWFPVGSVYSRKSRAAGWSKKIKPRALEEIDLPIQTTDMLSREKICFTGKGKYPRHTMQEIAIKNGAVISNTITSKTTLLVAGLNPGRSKVGQAKEKNITVISEEEFFKIINLA